MDMSKVLIITKCFQNFTSYKISMFDKDTGIMRNQIFRLKLTLSLPQLF